MWPSKIQPWLSSNSIDDTLIEIAKTNMEINIMKSWQKVEPTLQENIKALVA